MKINIFCPKVTQRTSTEYEISTLKSDKMHSLAEKASDQTEDIGYIHMRITHNNTSGK